VGCFAAGVAGALVGAALEGVAVAESAVDRDEGGEAGADYGDVDFYYGYYARDDELFCLDAVLGSCLYYWVPA